MYKLIGFLLLLFCGVANAQNLVTNGSFEAYTSCPDNLAQAHYSTGWRMYHDGTSDYFNCTTAPVATPANWAGYQVATQGTGYMGCITYSAGNTYYREYIASTMLPMVKGAKYEVSMSVSLANNSGYYSNNLGVWFYDNGPSATISGNVSFIPHTPQVTYSKYSAVTDTTLWVRLTDTFTADSAYDNLVIGGFGNAASAFQGATNHGSGTIDNSAYYLIDDIVVRRINEIEILQIDTSLCNRETLAVPYKLNYPQLFTPSNTFTVQLSDNTGSFNTPVNIGSTTGNTSGTISCTIPAIITPGNKYRIRITASNQPITSADNGTDLTIGILADSMKLQANNPVCETATLNLSAGFNPSGTTYTWSGANSFSASTQTAAVNNVAQINAGKYIVTANNYGCVSKDSVTIIVNPLPAKPIAIFNNNVCEGDSLKLSVSTTAAGTTYTWTGPNGYVNNNATAALANVTTSNAGKYTIAASLNNCTQYDTANISIKPKPLLPEISSNSPVLVGEDIMLNLNNSQSGVSYAWKGPAGFSLSAANGIINNAALDNKGPYTITAILNGCINANTLSVDVYTKETTDKFILYPSPNDGNFFIKSSYATNGNIVVNILNSRGRLAHTTTLTVTNHQINTALNLKAYLASGEYTLHFITAGNESVYKIVVIR